MFEYFTAAIAAAPRGSRDDLLGRLVSAEIDGERLSDWDILGFCFVVVAGGADTTAGLISHTVLLTGQHMDQRELLLAYPRCSRRAGRVPAPRVLGPGTGPDHPLGRGGRRRRDPGRARRC